MAETTRRGATTGPSGGPPGELPASVPDHLPFARAASVFAVVLLAGALFGYDQGVISGALVGIQKAFAVGAIALEIVTSWVTLGAMFGSLAGGYSRRPFRPQAGAARRRGAFHHRRARRGVRARTCRSSSLAGSWLASASASPRSPAPLYAAELAPAAQRGRFVSSYQLAITVGIFLAYFVDQALAGPEGWRAMLGSLRGPRRSPRARRSDRC